MQHKKLYKYYSFDDNKYWQAPIKDNYLFFSTYKTFNDPYEFYFNVNQDANWQTKLNYLQQGNPDSAYIQGMKTEAEVEEYLASLNLDSVWPNMNSLFTSLGICCFSKSREVILMWSHYCKSHSGFCVEFDMEKLNACSDGFDKINWTDISYVKSVPEFSIFSSLTFDEYVKYKFDSWSYEQEVRAFRIPTNFYFKPECITGITFGLNSINHPAGSVGKNNLIEIKDLISTHLPHVKNNLTLARKNTSNFKIDINKIDFGFLV